MAPDSSLKSANEMLAGGPATIRLMFRKVGAPDFKKKERRKKKEKIRFNSGLAVS